MKKSILCSSLLAALLLVGCANTGDKPSTDTSPDSTTTEPSPSPDTSPDTTPTPEEIKVTEVQSSVKNLSKYFAPDVDTFDLGKTITVLPEDATNKAVTYTSSNEDALTVSEDGILTIKKRGFNDVKVKVASVSDPTKFVEVNFDLGEVPTGFTFDHNGNKDVKEINIYVGDEEAVTVNCTNELGSYTGSWSFEDPELIKLAPYSAKFVGQKVGSTVATYTSKYDSSIKASLKVNVVEKAPVEQVPGIFEFETIQLGTQAIKAPVEFKNGDDVVTLTPMEVKEGTTPLGNSKVYGEKVGDKVAIKFGSGSMQGKASFTLPEGYKQVKIFVTKYKTDATVIKINDVEHQLTKSSNDGEWDEIVLDIPADRTVVMEGTFAKNCRFYVDKFEFIK